MARDAAVAAFESATGACTLAVAHLEALRSAAGGALSGGNLAAFLADACHGFLGVLRPHLLRFSYSPTGGLKLKKDLQEYGAALGALGGGPDAAREVERLLALANLYVVTPDALMGLVSGSLRMRHAEALRYLQCREDFKSARVEGRTLLELFSAEAGAMDKKLPAFKK